MRLPVRLIALSLSLAAMMPLGAQSAPSLDSTRDSSSAAASPAPAPVAVEQAPAAGAPLTGLRAGVHAPETARAAEASVAQSRNSMGQSQAMMVVGVAALIAGAVIGDTPGTIIMVGGAVIGLIGLYDYLK